jgi:hypothetical protein
MPPILPALAKGRGDTNIGALQAKALRELAGTEVPLVVRGVGLKGWLRESMCQAAIRILRATAALAEFGLPERLLTSR